MKLANISRRLRQIGRYARMGRSITDYPALALLGIARHREFQRGGIAEKMLPELCVRPRQLNGLRLALDPFDVTHMIIFDEIVVDNNYDLNLVPFPPDQIYDCGGHIGFFCVLASSRYPDIPLTVFEPNRRNVPRIGRNVDINHLKVRVLPAAVSVQQGTATFEDGASFGGHLLADNAREAGGNNRYEVEVLDLPAMIRQANPQRLLLKLDVEGEETKIIPALFEVLPQTCAVFFETHAGDADFDQAARQFRDHGFTVQRGRRLDNCTDGFALRT